MFGQWLTCRFRGGDWVRRSGRSKVGDGLTGAACLGRFQLFQLQFQLLDLPLQLLRLATELHAPQLGDQQLQMLDLALVREQLFMLAISSSADLKQPSSPAASSSIQIRQHAVRGSHTRSMPSTLRDANYVAAQKAVQIDPVNSDR